MAFNNLKGIDKSDVRVWASGKVSDKFREEILVKRNQSFTKLLKDGVNKHDENAESYKAYDRILKLLDEAANLK